MRIRSHIERKTWTTTKNSKSALKKEWVQDTCNSIEDQSDDREEEYKRDPELPNEDYVWKKVTIIVITISMAGAVLSLKN